jgi:cell division protein FtsL
MFWLALVGCLAMALVIQVYQFRKEFSYLQSLKRDEVNFEVVWGQLLLEQSALTQPSRLEQAAVKELNMHAPDSTEMVIVKP